MHAVALTTRKLAGLLLLIAALEGELAAIGARIDLGLAEFDEVGAAGNFLIHSLVGVQRVAALIDIAKLHGLADLQGAGIGLFLAGDHAEQRRLAGAVGAVDADNAAGRQLEAR